MAKLTLGKSIKEKAEEMGLTVEEEKAVDPVRAVCEKIKSAKTHDERDALIKELSLLVDGIVANLNDNAKRFAKDK